VLKRSTALDQAVSWFNCGSQRQLSTHLLLACEGQSVESLLFHSIARMSYRFVLIGVKLSTFVLASYSKHTFYKGIFFRLILFSFNFGRLVPMSTKRYINYLLSLSLLFAATFGVYHSSEHLAVHEHKVIGLGGYDFVYSHSGGHDNPSLGDRLDTFCGVCTVLSSVDLWSYSGSCWLALRPPTSSPRLTLICIEDLKLPYFSSRAPPSIA